jgi:2'-5' RNA ligase
MTKPKPKTDEAKAADDTGAMISLYIPTDVGQRLALPGGEPVGELHLTLAYFGDMEDIAENRERVKQFVAEFAATHYLQPARIGGIGRFNRVNSDGTQAVYATVDSPNLPQFRQELVSGASWAADVEVNRNYGFVPHVTLAYIPADAPMPIQNIDPMEFQFKRVSLTIGPERYDYDLVTEAQYINSAAMAMGLTVKAGARNSAMDMGRIQGAHDLMCELGAKCAERDGMVYSEKAANLAKKLKDAGATLDEIIGIYANREDGQKYYVNFGDWATKETIDAAKKILGDIESEAEAPPPEDKWQQVWPRRGKAKDPNVGGGVDRSKLKDSDFVFPDSRTFPVVTPGDVSDAASSWGRYRGEHSFEEFKKRLTALAKRKGEEFVKQLPEKWKEEKQEKSTPDPQGERSAFDTLADAQVQAVDGTPSTVATNALKAISQDDDRLVVGNYLALFGDTHLRDLEGVMSANKNADGSNGEYFTPSTQFDSDYTATGRLMVDWEHGHDPDQQDAMIQAPGRDDVLGYVDWATAKADGNGLWVQRVLNRRNRYVKMLETLIQAGLIGTSSDAVPDRVAKKANGEITTWPLRRDTLTVSPMEPRMMDQNTLQALKALALEVPAIKAACERWGIEMNGKDRDIARLRLKSKQLVF